MTTPRGAENLKICVGPFAVSLSLNSDRIYDLLKSRFSLARTNAEGEVPLAHVQLTSDHSRGIAQYQLWKDGSLNLSTPDFSSFAAYVEHFFDRFFVVNLRDYLLFHGSAVAKNQRALLFVGNTGMGKTTLAAHLIRRFGFAFLTDDLVIADPRTGTVLPYPKFLKIKRGGKISYLDPGISKRTEASAIHTVMILKKANEPERLSHGKAVIELIQYNLNEWGADLPRLTSRLARLALRPTFYVAPQVGPANLVTITKLCLKAFYDGRSSLKRESTI